MKLSKKKISADHWDFSELLPAAVESFMNTKIVLVENKSIEKMKNFITREGFQMIEVKAVSKYFGNKQVLSNIDLNVSSGNIFGLIGVNGAGKTTLIKCLTGIYKLNEGEIKINSASVFDNVEVKKIVGYVSDENDYFSYFTVKEVLKFYKLTYDSFSIDRFSELNYIFKVPEKTMIRSLSKGMKMRLSIMLNLSIMPKVLILDEPTNGLDPIIKKEFINILLDDVSERGTTIFLSSHNLSDLERICDSVAIIDKGQIVYKNSIEEMKKTIRKIQVVFKDSAPEDLSKWHGTLHVDKIGRVNNIITSSFSEEFKDKLNKSGAAFIEEIDLSLEDMFIYSVGGDFKHEELFK